MIVREGFCGRTTPVDVDLQRRMIAAYYEVLLSCSKDEEHTTTFGQPSFITEVICGDLHGMFCDALESNCEVFHKMIEDVVQNLKSRQLSLQQARSEMDELMKEFVS